MYTKEIIPETQELYRNNVALITFREPNFLLVNLNVWPPDYWKFPQGGINPGESLETAAEREFREELGSKHIRILGKSQIFRRYKWEKPIQIDGKHYVGQDQTFLVVEFMGQDNEIILSNNEIRQYRWTTPQSLKSFIFRTQLDFQNYWETINNILHEQRHVLLPKGIDF